MMEQNVWILVNKYGVMAREINKEVPKNVHPHLLRHSWAMVFYHYRVDLTLIAR